MSEEVRVALFAPYFEPYGRGISIDYRQVIDRTPNAKFNVLTHNHDKAPRFEREGATTIYRLLPEGDTFRTLPLVTTAAFSLIARADVVRVFTHYPHVAIIAKIADLFDRLLIYDCRDLQCMKPEIIAHPADVWTSPSEQVDELIYNEFPNAEVVRFPIINPPEVSSVSTSQQPIDSPFEVVLVGTLREYKRVGMALDAFESLTEYDDLRLRIVGSGRLEKELKQRVNRNKELQRMVQFTGEVSHGDTIQFIAGADVLLHVSRTETGPRVVLEALELGTPVVSTKVGLVPEVITDGVSGFLIEGDDESIAEQIEYLYNNQEKLNSVAKEGKDAYATYREQKPAGLTKLHLKNYL